MIRLENVLKIFLQDVLKTSWRRLEDVFQDVLKMFWRRLQNVLKMSWRRFCKKSWRCLEDVLETYWRRLEPVWPIRIYWSWPRHLENVLKTFSEDVRLRRTNSSWRRLHNVFWRRRRKTSSRCLQDVFIKTNVCWVISMSSNITRQYQRAYLEPSWASMMKFFHGNS